MGDWIRTAAGLQMAETITRYLPRILVCLEDLVKVDDKKYEKYKDDLLKITDEMDIRQQENINLNFKVDELKHKLENSIKYDQTSFTPTDDGSWKGR